MNAPTDPAAAPRAAATTAPGAAARMSPAQALQAVCGLLTASFVAVLVSSPVPVALPRLVADADGSASWYGWVVAAELLAMGATVPLWARLAWSRRGRGLVQAALVLVVAGSLLAGASTGAATLLTGRVLQGVGAGGLAVGVQLLLAAVLPPGGLGRFSGLFGAAFAVATLGGPVVGGVLAGTDRLGWRWCFFLAVPFALLAVVLLRGALRLDPAREAAPAPSGGLLRRPPVALAAVAGAAVGLVTSLGTVALATHLQVSLGHRPAVAGLLLVPMAAGLLAASALSGAVVATGGGSRWFLPAGAAAVVLAAASLARPEGRSSTALVVGAGAVLGVGLGLLVQDVLRAGRTAVLAGSDPEGTDRAAVGGLVSAAGLLGSGLGLLALSGALADRVPTGAAVGLLLPVALVAAAAVLALAAVAGRARSDQECAGVPPAQRPTA